MNKVPLITVGESIPIHCQAGQSEQHVLRASRMTFALEFNQDLELTEGLVVDSGRGLISLWLFANKGKCLVKDNCVLTDFSNQTCKVYRVL